MWITPRKVMNIVHIDIS